jgi:DNA-binding protein YbaB
MNIVYLEENPVIAKTCGCKEKNRQKITYAFSEEFHSLCMDKKYIIQAEIEACERLLKYAMNDSERAVIEKEIAELKAALDLMP